MLRLWLCREVVSDGFQKLWFVERIGKRERNGFAVVFEGLHMAVIDGSALSHSLFEVFLLAELPDFAPIKALVGGLVIDESLLHTADRFQKRF